MARHVSAHLQVRSIRPLLRYVDGERAAIGIRITIHRSAAPPDGQTLTATAPIDLLIQMPAYDGTVVEDFAAVDSTNPTNVVHLAMIISYFWWTAGIGQQTLYDLLLTFLAKNEAQAKCKTTIHPPSVRPDQPSVLTDIEEQSMLLANGTICLIQSTAVADPQNEHEVPAPTGDSLLLLRAHSGLDHSYDAADRTRTFLFRDPTQAHLESHFLSLVI